MKTIPVALAALVASPAPTLAVCLELTRTDGVVLRATSHDQDLPIDGETYYARSGGTLTDIHSSAALNVDESEMTALLTLDAISETDLKGGIYDYATHSRFLVNYNDTTQGRISQQDGRIGQVTVDRLTFIAQLRGLMQSLQQSFGNVCTANCPHTLGSTARLALGLGDCTKDLTAFTFTGTLDDVSPDQLTFYDAARLEAGPALGSPGGGIAILSITNANPCVVTLAADLGQASGTAVNLSGSVPAPLNGVVTVRNVNGATFEIDLDTSDTAVYIPYVSGGVVTPLGGASGYFDYGLFTLTSGQNTGRSVEVKSYVTGQWTTQDRFPFDVNGDETYSIVAGCDKNDVTCRTKFDNLINFGGYPEVPGQDSVVQVGRHQ